MLEIPEWVPAEAVGWAAVVAGLAILAAWIALSDRRMRKQQASPPAVPQSRPAYNWHEARASRDVARALEIAAMQATAAEQIDAVEHAYNRMLAQCAGVIGHLTPRKPEPAREAVAVETPARRPLAA